MQYICVYIKKSSVFDVAASIQICEEPAAAVLRVCRTCRHPKLSFRPKLSPYFLCNHFLTDISDWSFVCKLLNIDIPVI